MMKRRIIIEMGMGADLYGQDQTKAALRAVESAIRRSSIPLFENLGMGHEEMDVRVTIGAPDPEQVDLARVEAALPRGKARATAVKGGLTAQGVDGAGPVVIATAAVEVFLPDQSGKWALSGD